MPDEPVSDVISGGRDPDRRPTRPWRLIAGVTAAVLIVGGAAIHLILAGSHHPPRPRAQAAPSAVALTAPSMLHGTPLPPGGAPSTRLFLGGDQLQLLNVGGRAPASLTTVLLGAAAAGDPLGSDPAVQQITSAAGGIVALIFSHGSAGLPDIGDVIFVPVSTSGTGAPRIIARANYMALAPNRRDIWVEQAAPPWGNGPAGSRAWLVDEDGHRLTGARDLGSRALVAATVGGLFVRGPDQKLVLIDASNGSAEPTGVPGNAIIAGADADDVAWQAATCAAGCSLHITDLRGRPGTQIALPPGTVIDPNDTSDFDPAGRRFALPLDIIGHRGVVAGTSVYVADISARTLVRLPGGPIPVANLPAVVGAFPAGSSDVVSARWAADGSGLWIVATDGLYFQVAYWTGYGPLQILRPQAGLAYKFDVPGTGPADQASSQRLPRQGDDTPKTARAESGARDPPLGGRGRVTVVLNLVLIGLAITLSSLW